MKILSKLGGFSVFQGNSKSSGKPFYKFEYNHKKKDSNEYEKIEMLLYPEQFAALAMVATNGANKIADMEAENATNLMTERMADKASAAQAKECQPSAATLEDAPF